MSPPVRLRRVREVVIDPFSDAEEGTVKSKAKRERPERKTNGVSPTEANTAAASGPAPAAFPREELQDDSVESTGPEKYRKSKRRLVLSDSE